MEQRLYVAGTGLITPVGETTEMTAASVAAGLSSYEVSEFDDLQEQPITMAAVPAPVFDNCRAELDYGDYFSGLHERVLKLAILAVRQALSGVIPEKPVPLILAMPEPLPDVTLTPAALLVANLLAQAELPIDRTQIKCLASGRAAGIQALKLAQSFLYEKGNDFVLVGGSDSFWHFPVVAHYARQKRLSAPYNMEGFVAGEGAGFLLLTRNPALAKHLNRRIVALSEPGLSHEPGHMLSGSRSAAEGLDSAFKQVFAGYNGRPVRAIYSSMNGERYWVKEYGVAYTRNKQRFVESPLLYHPADCYGDLGAAAAPALLALSAHEQFHLPQDSSHLIYCSSDSQWRAAVCMETIQV